jgi:serine/threonine protein kinase
MFRIPEYNNIVSSLEKMTANQKIDLLKNSTNVIKEGVAGSKYIVNINNTEVFVKTIALTDFDMTFANYEKLSTSNYYNLPVECNYHWYPNFQGWRELFIHKLVSNWVLSRVSVNFPVLFHFFVAEWKTEQNISKRQIKIGNMFLNNPQVSKRLNDVYASNFSIVLFMEYFPITLMNCITRTDFDAHKLCKLVSPVLNFMESKGFVHYDLHLGNILIHDNYPIIIDYGACASLEFGSLSTSEKQFIKDTLNYSKASFFATFTAFASKVKINHMDDDFLQFIVKFAPIEAIYFGFLDSHGDGQIYVTKYPKQVMNTMFSRTNW